jgi:hypothetical protein
MTDLSSRDSHRYGAYMIVDIIVRAIQLNHARTYMRSSYLKLVHMCELSILGTYLRVSQVSQAHTYT